MTVHRIMHLVLNLFEKCTRSWCIDIIINTGGIYISEFLIKASFTQPYLPNFGKQMFKIILSDKRAILHSFLVYHISTNSKLAKHICTPLPELCGTSTINPIANTNDSIKIIEFQLTIYLTFTFHLNNREILGCYHLYQLSTFIYIFQVKSDIICGAVK
ncbi:hypothetical protein M080_1118 [Bacteroides fragilis str. 3397 T10]|nr:hypothetical protein M080_1118 [Bacteroides fragilis str. 3397 T10]EXZ54812.1 hypothetical protein M108_1153 [Bacteroides fragilis str. 3397 T14]EYA44690.1 hypothetical protein M110_1224 [Bacteroides fragilis str. 3397 N3]